MSVSIWWWDFVKWSEQLIGTGSCVSLWNTTVHIRVYNNSHRTVHFLPSFLFPFFLFSLFLSSFFLSFSLPSFLSFFLPFFLPPFLPSFLSSSLSFFPLSFLPFSFLFSLFLFSFFLSFFLFFFLSSFFLPSFLSFLSSFLSSSLSVFLSYSTLRPPAHCSCKTVTVVPGHTQLNTPQSVGLLWTGDQLIAETSTWQQTDIHAFGGNRTRNPSKRAPAEPPGPAMLHVVT